MNNRKDSVDKRTVRRAGGARTASSHYRKKRRRKFKLRTGCLKFFVIVLLFIATALLMFLSPYFNIKYIDTVNIKNLTHEQILMVGQINVGDNIFKVNLKKVEHSIRTLSYVDDVKLKRKLPFNKVVIKVTESVPMARLSFGTGYMVIDRNGKLLESIDENNQKASLPLVLGVDTNQFEIGEKIQTQTDIIKQVAHMLDELGKYDLRNRVTSIDVTDDYNILLVLDANKHIKVGDTFKLSHKILMLNGVLKEVGINESGRIDLNYDNKVIFSPGE